MNPGKSPDSIQSPDQILQRHRLVELHLHGESLPGIEVWL